MTPECYSPLPPAAYTRYGHGHGQWYELDIPKWNLVWLSVPELDLYLDADLKMNEILATIDNEYVGTVVASLHPEVIEVYPNLREHLNLPRSQFMSAFIKGPWAQLPAFGRYGMKWIDTLRARSKTNDPHTLAQAITTEATHRAVSNVIEMSRFRK